MATAYTEGIIDGSTKTFKDFALICARAFGAAAHMIDDELSVKFKERIPDSFWDEQIKESEKMVEEIKSLSDENIIKRKKENIEKSLERHKKEIEDKLRLKIKLNRFYLEAKNYKPPTEDHKEVKYFMIEQLESTIEWECDVKYNEDEINRLNKELNNLNPETIRLDYLSNFYKSLELYNNEKKKELERCENSNNWYKAYLKSLE